MYELYVAAFSGVNIVYTLLLGFVLLYWLIVILGILDLDAFDFDLDADLNGDVGGFEGTEGGFSWLAFFNVGEVPVMFFVTLVVLTMWVVSIQVNSVLDTTSIAWITEHRTLTAAVIAIPNFIFAMFLAKYLVLPAKRLRKEIVQTTDRTGMVCLVTSLEINPTQGRCETSKEDGSLILSARTFEGEILHKGDSATIVEHIVEGDMDYYMVTKADDLVEAV